MVQCGYGCNTSFSQVGPHPRYFKLSRSWWCLACCLHESLNLKDRMSATLHWLPFPPGCRGAKSTQINTTLSFFLKLSLHQSAHSLTDYKNYKNCSMCTLVQFHETQHTNFDKYSLSILILNLNNIVIVPQNNIHLYIVAYEDLIVYIYFL